MRERVGGIGNAGPVDVGRSTISAALCSRRAWTESLRVTAGAVHQKYRGSGQVIVVTFEAEAINSRQPRAFGGIFRVRCQLLLQESIVAQLGRCRRRSRHRVLFVT